MIPLFIVNTDEPHAAHNLAKIVAKFIRRNRKISLETAQNIAMAAVHGAIAAAKEAESVTHA